VFFIPGWLISLATFPGVIVHEAAHKFFADRAGVRVHKVCYFRLGNPAGYVVHDPPKGLRQSFLISIGPLIFNTILCALITLPIPFLDPQSNLILFLGWLGYSIGMHSFPSNQDMDNFIGTIKSTHRKGVLLIAAKIFAGLLRIANALRFFWFDLIYAVGVAAFLPWIILQL
jgi:hypothetical protein